MPLKFSILNFLNGLYIFILGVPLKLPDFRIVATNLWKSETPVSKVLDNLNRFLLLVSIRSIHAGLLKACWFVKKVIQIVSLNYCI